MTDFAFHTARPSRRSYAGVSILTRLSTLASLYRSRRDLAGLDAAQLDDIGISRREAEIESARPLWDAPAHWQE